MGVLEGPRKPILSAIRCVGPSRFQPITPYESDPKKWEAPPWIDRYTGNAYQMGGTGAVDEPDAVRLQTYSGVIREFRSQPEAKSADIDGHACSRKTVGLLDCCGGG